MKPYIASLLGTGLIAFLAAACLSALSAAPPVASDPASSEHGRLLFRIHCQTCHGEHGDGNGPLAEALKVPPADLRTIAQRRGGDFPRDEIHQIIDGRMAVVGHGRSEMPIWGLTLLARDTDAASEQDVEQRIEDLVRFLESIQEPVRR